MCLKIFLFCTVVLTVHFCHAQEIELNPVTITATLKPVAASRTGRNITVISGDQFQNLPVHSIDELLRYVPGIEVQARGPMGTQSDFLVRGGTFQHVLVIIDGLRLNDPNTGHFSSYIPIAPSEIARIEVLKGAASALYGSDAVGGVIHIITKTFAATGEAGLLLKTQGQAMAGAYGFWHANAGFLLVKNKTAVAIGVLTNNAKGQMARGTRSFFNLHTVSLSASQYLNPYWQLAFRTAYDSRDFNAQNYYTASVADTAVEKVSTFWNQVQLAYAKNKNRISFTAGYKTVDDRFQFNPVITANQNTSQLWQAITVYEHSFTSKTVLVSGVQFQNRSINSNDRGNHDVKQSAAFAVLQQTIGSSLHVSPALRYDWDQRSGSEVVPQINLSYQLSEFQLRGSAGKTIRQADFTERYNNYNRTTIPSGSRVGNPELQAERSFSYEAGVDVLPGKNVKIAATFFRREHQDLIDYVLTPVSQMPRQQNLLPTGNYFLAKNIARIQTSGFETDVQWNKRFSKVQVTAAAGAVWLQTENNFPPSLYIASHARFLTNFSAHLATGRFAFSFNGLYKSRNPQRSNALGITVSKDYFVMNSRAEFFLFEKRMRLVAQADNIFDRRYSDLLGAWMPGRWLMAGLKLSL